ncbi:unnamed protein product [Scomber scombrus]|uniref:Unnamed protein product n=1 Tax=Scomber scombrus TaxID=13677 RepID=A0AAV1Q2M6_SCOSC
MITLLVLKESSFLHAHIILIISRSSSSSHSMPCLVRLSSSSDTVMVPMYQSIQKNRLRKMNKGPVSTKKSQELSGAKIPTKKMMRPAMSKITANDRKKLGQVCRSLVLSGEDILVAAVLVV